MKEQKGLGYYLKRLARASKETGTFAHAVHRITGLLLVLYLVIHIIFMSQARLSGQTFDEVIETFKTPPFLIIDLVIFMGVVLHGLNGIRITLFDLGVGIRRQKELFWAVLILTAIATAWAFIIILPKILEGI